jgi:N6-adenosine-specific RNA methylase IME4
VNPARVEKFSAVYLEALTAAVREHPDEYAFPAEHTPAVASRMMRAVTSGTFNHEGHAFAGTCRALGIKHTRGAILAFLHDPAPFAPPPYSILYADPPWAYRNRTIRGGAEHHYRTLSVQELAAFTIDERRVVEHTAPDSVLFLWATWPMLTEALYIMKAWGFTYKTCAFTWVKTTAAGKAATGLGHYTRGNTEPVLLGVRGRGLKRINAGVPQVALEDGLPEEEAVLAPRGPHSAKPAEVRERIVKLYGDVPRLEMFARQRVAGWDAHGDGLP